MKIEGEELQAKGTERKAGIEGRETEGEGSGWEEGWRRQGMRLRRGR